MEGVTADYTVEGMVCQHCASSVTEAITSLGGVRDVTVEVQSGRVSVNSDEALDEVQLAKVLDDIGYEFARSA
ncbi:heavy-metal-associated domain-containing protein [Streptomyces sp. NPDC056486]|uniref:heavy-metal-associated domain-containing protein n=1 Tax=Streptomyces sp. NPDC056486 TaxID=3345835 RepID=UPI003690DF3B